MAGRRGMGRVGQAWRGPRPHARRARHGRPAGGGGERPPAGRGDPGGQACPPGGSGPRVSLRADRRGGPRRAVVPRRRGGPAVSEAPDDVRALAEARQRARQARDFARADELRERIRRAGFDVADTPSGWELAPLEAEAPDMAAPVHTRSEDVPSVLEHPPAFDGPSIQWVMQGWPEDVLRSLRSVQRTLPDGFQPVIVEAAGAGVLDWYRGELVHI